MKITVCACASRKFIDKENVARLVVAARKAGIEVEIVSDLCEMCEEKNDAVHEVAKTTIVACYPRAVKSLMAYVGEDDCQSLDLRSNGVNRILQELTGNEQPEIATDLTEEEMQVLNQIDSFDKKLGCDAWYPTIDKDVCAECGKCFEFCPFGVYEMVEDRIRVMHPHNCKNNCPACARMCPASAIIFPKYDRSPINGGEVKEENAIQLDTKTLYNQALRERLASRRSGIRLTND